MQRYKRVTVLSHHTTGTKKMKPLNVAVVGVGQMGANHLKAYLKRSDINIVGIVEVRTAHAKKLADEFNCHIVSLEDLPGKVDAVSIVTPSATHFPIGKYLLENGIHCLIEKPLATNMEQCKALVEVARRHQSVLVVGHVEEYNNGFRYLKDSLSLSNEKPEYIFCERLNYGSQRILDTDVILDLMIHDVGCVIDLLGRDVKNLTVSSASGYGRTTNAVDVVVATLKTPTCLINLQASRLSHHRHRQFSLHTKIHSYFLNYISQQVSIYREGQLSSQTSHPWQSPLENEINHFVECIRDRTKTILTSGEKAGITMHFVEEIQNRIYKR